MEKYKGKYEIILGFITLVVSLSAFKDELAAISLDLGYTSLTLSQYFLYSVYGFSICLYFYIIEYAVRETRIGHWKIFDYIIAIAYIIFILVLIFPFVILLNIVSVKIYNYLSVSSEQEKSSIFILILIITHGISIILSFLGGNKLFKNRQESIKQEAETQQILEIENAIKLYESGYFANSIIETFKALESYLQKKLIEKNHRAPISIFEMLSVSVKANIISKEDQASILSLKRMRNNAAHNTGVTLSQEDAHAAIEFFKNLISRG